MKHMIACAAALMILCCLSGCGGDSQESLMKEGLTTMTELVAVLDGVKDEASATSAKPKVKSLMDKMESINQRQAKLPAPSETEIKAMESKYGKQMEDVMQKMMGHAMRIQFDPKISAVLNDIDMKPRG
jgi:hypothetical protein